MESYHLYNVVPALFEFIEDLTNWYIRLKSKSLLGRRALVMINVSAFSTLYRTLVELSQIMAPFAPFLSEHTFQELKSFGEELPFLFTFRLPCGKIRNADETLEDAMSRIQQIILLGRQKRNQISVKVKTPLSQTNCYQ